MNIFGIGLPEMVLILVVALLIFGPKKLPEVGRSLGKALKGFQDASKEFENEFKRQADLLQSDAPLEATLETESSEASQKQLEASDAESVVSSDAEISGAEVSDGAIDVKATEVAVSSTSDSIG
jgi:sec-independent protein translocase protein TatA